MLRVCKYCGKQYEGDSGGSCCPDCAAAQRKTSLRQRICVSCGISFVGGPAARYCPECRAERIREQKRRFRKHGPARPLGSMDNCILCGKQYIVTGGMQHYCPDCAPIAYRELDRAASLRWQRENTTPEERKKIRKDAAARIPCVICGKPFVPRSYRQVTCSPECAAEQKRRNQTAYEAAHKEARKEARNRNRRKQLEAMTPEEREAYRLRANERSRENYRKRMERKKEEEV